MNGVKTKLEKCEIKNLLLEYDIIALNEIRTSLPVTFSGYVAYRSRKVAASHRGGTLVLVKNCLASCVRSVDTSVIDQVWIEFKNVPKVVFGFVYVPPSDSPYFSFDSFSALRNKLQNRYFDTQFVIVGDMNTRFGTTVRDVLRIMEIPGKDMYSYPDVDDEVVNANENAEIFSTICIDQSLLIVNNLKTAENHFRGKKTFRRKGSGCQS